MKVLGNHCAKHLSKTKIPFLYRINKELVEGGSGAVVQERWNNSNMTTIQY